jgi:hypothetical protein
MRPVQRGVLVFVLAAFCLTKSLLCNVAVFTGMLFISKSSEFISLIWKEPFMTSSSVTSWKKATSVFKAIFSVQGRFCADSNSEKSDHMFPSGQPSEASGLSSVSNNPSGRRGDTVRTPISM